MTYQTASVMPAVNLSVITSANTSANTSAKNFSWLPRFLFVALLSVLLSACGGGGSSAPAAGEKPTDIFLTGTATYTDYGITAIGIDYANPVQRPIRGAIVELQNQAGQVTSLTTTSETGEYNFGVPVNSTVRVVVSAKLGVPGGPNTQVLDNTNGDSLYQLVSPDIPVGEADIEYNFFANSGWDASSSSYAGPRDAAPFAILDVIYQAQQLITSVDGSINSLTGFPLLTVYWSAKNQPVDGDKTLGNIGTTSAYDKQTNAIYVLGKENIDTDEYDSHVIAHEWTHYFIKNFGRTDSPGGSHIFFNDILHPSVAFDEGFADAMSAIILKDPLYIVSHGDKQGLTNSFNLESDWVPDTEMLYGKLKDGMYSENSVSEVVYDIFDSGTSDDDLVGLGFGAIYLVLTNQQKTTPAFTSMASFLYYIKQVSPLSASAIDALALAENIQPGDEFQQPTGMDLPLYTDVPADGTPVTHFFSSAQLLTTSDVFGPVSATDPGNKYQNFIFFRVPLDVTGCYTFIATPKEPTPNADLLLGLPFATGFPSDNGFSDDTENGVAETYSHNFKAGDPRVFAVGAFSPQASFDVKFASTDGACAP